MNRGEIWWVDFDTSIGGEIKKKRPAIIVSNDKANKYLNRVQVVPLTSNVAKLYPGEAYVTIGSKNGKALTSQITTVSKVRLLARHGSLSDLDMENVENALFVQLGLSKA